MLLLQLCLLLLFAQDVFCFSLGYPFLPGYLADHGHAGFGTAAAFGIYGAASIATLLLLLMVSSSRASSSRGLLQRPSAKYWLIVASTSLTAAAGAANTAAPESYAVLLITKAVQGSASALYFVFTLNLVAAVFPAAYKTQAMAFVSAGLTLGDALGPVAGGVVYQLKGLRQALGMQPLASGLALLALLMLVVAWPSRKRPWALQQQHQKRQKPQQQYHHADVESAAAAAAAAELSTPLLFHHHDQGPPASPAAAAAAGLAAESTVANHQCITVPHTARPGTAAAAAAAAAAADAGASKCHQAAPSLLQLLSNQGVLSLCLLALMCQAARTALDLLLPMLLQDSVQPGVVGALFAGEAVGSVVTPFLVDWLLQKQAESSDSLQDSCEKCVAEQEQQQQQQQHMFEYEAHIGSCRKSAVSSDTHRVSRQQSSCCSRQCDRHVKCSSSSSSSSRTALTANKLLFISAGGMAVACCLALTAWQLPALGCGLVQASSSSSSSSSSGGAAMHPPAWLCSHTDAMAAAAAAAAGRRRVTKGPGVAGAYVSSPVGDSRDWWSRHVQDTVRAARVMAASNVQFGLMLGLRGSPTVSSLAAFVRQHRSSSGSDTAAALLSISRCPSWQQSTTAQLQQMTRQQ
jgi:hypothetical protein